MKVALVYDKINKWGGAERVLLALHKLFPDAPLYTSIYDREKTPWANVFEIRTSFLQHFPFANHHELYAFLMPLAFESFNFDEFDLVISVTSEAAKGIVTKPETKHICYCLTPTRYLWSGYNEYFKNPLLKFISEPTVLYLKFWDKIASSRPDAFIAISKEVQSRIKKYYKRESELIYPPLALDNGPVGKVSAVTPYFLIVSRLVSYKRIDLAIKTFNKLKLPLKIIGTGAEMNRLKRMAGPTIKFLGNLTDKELVRYYSDCRALVFPGIEDFGLTVLEAQSFGKPIIAFKAGGALETIIEGKTGIFFDKPTVESLAKTIQKLSNLKINPEDCIEQARKFDFGQFRNNFMKKVKEMLK
jgi:glycosyltransferase involved in cell wall biosynthesis